MRLRKVLMTVCMIAGASALTAPVFPNAADTLGQGRAIVTVLPLERNGATITIPQSRLRTKLNGKDSGIVDWTPLNGSNGDLELVIMIDSSAHAGIGLQLDEIAGFIRNLPAGAKVAVSYMDAGRAAMKGALSADRNLAIDALRIPAGGAGSNASPYFCLSDLAKNWPSKDPQARREVIMMTDGVDNYYPGYSPDDPYLQASIRDSVRAGLVVYSIYMPNRGPINDSACETNAGQSLLTDLTSATGGYTYWDGSSRRPVSLVPYLDDIAHRLRNQYRLRFQSRLKGKTELQRMSLEVVNDGGVRVFAPRRVNVLNPAAD